MANYFLDIFAYCKYKNFTFDKGIFYPKDIQCLFLIGNPFITQCEGCAIHRAAFHIQSMHLSLSIFTHFLPFFFFFFFFFFFLSYFLQETISCHGDNIFYSSGIALLSMLSRMSIYYWFLRPCLCILKHCSFLLYFTLWCLYFA